MKRDDPNKGLHTIASPGKAGRGVRYEDWITPEGLNYIMLLARGGRTDAEIAECIGIARSTLYSWMNKCKDIEDNIKKGRYDSVVMVENALYKTATGYDIVNPDGTVSHVNGDKTAQIFWLKNRERTRWRDNPHSRLDDEEQTARIKKLLKESEEQEATKEIKVIIEGDDSLGD